MIINPSHLLIATTEHDHDLDLFPVLMNLDPIFKMHLKLSRNVVNVQLQRRSPYNNDHHTTRMSSAYATRLSPPANRQRLPTSHHRRVPLTRNLHLTSPCK